jgi:heme O synthase-like polyprenyltransferase
MLIRRIDTSKAEPRVGDVTKRIVVFLFGALFAVLSTAAAFAAAYGVAALLGVPAIVLFAITFWGKRKSVVAAEDAASIVKDIAHLP